MINIEELRRRIDWGYKVANGVVIELLDRLEAAEKERDALRAEFAQLHKEADKFEDGIDWIQRALQAEVKIEAMGRQEPVAWMSSRNGFICKENKNPDYNVPLCALTGAQGEEK